MAGPWRTNIVKIEHSDTEFVNRHFMKFTGTTANIDSAVGVGATSIDVDDASVFSSSDRLFIRDNNQEEMNHVIITSIVTNTIKLDRPIDLAYTTAGEVELVRADMKTEVGSLSSPVVYKVQPPANEIWHVLRIIIAMADGSAMDNSGFGSIANGIANGVVIRTVVNGVNRTLTNWKTNGDMKEDMFDVNFTDKAGGGNFGLEGRWTFAREGVISILNGSSSDRLEILVQDDLTDLIDFQIKLKGHIA